MLLWFEVLFEFNQNVILFIALLNLIFLARSNV